MPEPTGEGRGAGHPREPFLTSQANGGLQVFEILMGSWGSPWIGSESSGLVTSTGGSKFHAHHPAINSYQHLSWYVSDEGPFKPFNLMFGLSYNTSFAYQKSSTRYTDSNAEAFNLSKPTFHPFIVWKLVENVPSLWPLIIHYTRWNYLKSTSYPEGNLGGKSYYIDGLISLLPLYPAPMINLHARISMDFHWRFLWLHPGQE